MFNTILKRVTAIAVPVLLLIVAMLVLPRIQRLPAEQMELAQFVPYMAVVFGLLLSLGFNRGRIFFVLLMLGFTYWCIRTYLLGGITGFTSHCMFQFLSTLLPFNVVVFSSIRERGIFSSAGRLRIGFLLLQVGVVAWIIRYRHDYGGISALMGKEIIRSRYLDNLVIPQLSLAVLVMGLMVIIYLVITRRNPVHNGMLGVLVATGVTCNWLWTPQVPLVFLTAAAVILSLSVLQDTHNMAFRDDLTGLPSRRALNEQLMGLGRRYTVAMLDVDHFKRFNDTYGHDIGDQVLKMVGAKIGAVRGGGKPYRYGGEEFSVIFPGKEPGEVLPHLEDLRKAIADYQLWIRGNDRPKRDVQGKPQRGDKVGKQAVSVTISIGVAASSDSLKGAEEVFRAADKALYRAKERGRNLVCT